MFITLRVLSRQRIKKTIDICDFKHSLRLIKKHTKDVEVAMNKNFH